MKQLSRAKREVRRRLRLLVKQILGSSFGYRFIKGSIASFLGSAKFMSMADDIIRMLDLQPLAMEGGFFRETYRSKQRLSPSCLGDPYQQEKAAGTAIYYLLTPDTFSALHRLPTDEIFHHYCGGVVEMLQLWPDGSSDIVHLGGDLVAGQRPQVVVPAGVWQGSRLLPGDEFALMGTTMAPGFDYADFESGIRGQLIERYPGEERWIRLLTK